MNVEFQSIKQDIASFADDENDVIYDERGNILFTRLGKTVEIQISESDSGLIMVKSNGREIPYKTYIAKELAQLDLMANKIVQRTNRQEMDLFVDPDATIVSIGRSSSKTASAILKEECDHQAFVGTKVCFVTADAGHGKSMSLHHFQYRQANSYLRGESKYLFWHIDLHGRELVRLNEAIMYELGELRLTGIYYSSILTLLRLHLLVLAIDGFDELAAEQGGDIALNSLSNLVYQMQGHGVLVAASRRTFFDSQDYLRRSGLLRQKDNTDCVFTEIKILNWREKQCKNFLANYAFEASEYEKLVHILSGESHPLLERPFLFTKLIKYSFDSSTNPSDFVSKDYGHMDSINGVIEAFVRREVDKWTHYDKETGRPYLSFEQHISLLAEIAFEMWSSQKDVLSNENIQLLLTMLMDEWSIDASLRPKITTMVSSHAMLVGAEGLDGYKRFDHEEFKYYFFARSLEKTLEKDSVNGDMKNLHSCLSLTQLPDSVAQYFASRIETSQVLPFVNSLLAEVEKEWKSTSFQSNVGTILPYVLNNYIHKDVITISNKVVFSSLVLENKYLENILFDDCVFMNISFNNTILTNIVFQNCQFNEIKVVLNSANRLNGVSISSDCRITRASLIDGEEESTEFAPNKIVELLESQGFSISAAIKEETNNYPVICNSDYYKAIKRLLNKYTKTTCIYEKDIESQSYLNFNNPAMVMDDILPLLERYEIVTRKENRKTRQAGTYGWALARYDVSEIFKAEEDDSSPLNAFWSEVKSHS